MRVKYDMPVDLDEFVNRPPPKDDAIVKFGSRIVLQGIRKQNDPIVENISVTGAGDIINGVSKDERRGIQFWGTQVIRVFSSY